MDMMIVAIVVAAIIVFLAFKQKANPEDGECASEIVDVFRKDRKAGADQVVVVMKKHNRTTANIDQVTKLMKPKLMRTGIPKDDVNDALVTIRKAKTML